MDQGERAALSERSDTLRSELKAWEKTFASTNDGRKASRDDIKKHPDIAAKYKEYNKTRDILSGKIVQPPPIQSQTPRKRKHEAGHDHPSKRFQTPSKTVMQPWDVDPYESPSMIRKLFTPSRKTAIGPTPQKDGQVLGIFDLLEESRTPSKGVEAFVTNIELSINATPRKARNGVPGTPSHARTPSSTGKMLDKFATPLSKIHPNKQTGTTPSSVSKLHFSTPSFLRRNSQRPLMPFPDHDDDILALSPEPVRVPRKPLVRGLSSILAGLRKIEEEAADEDLEALNEMENEMRANDNPQTKEKAPAPKDTAPVEEDRPRLPLGGFDDEGMYDSEHEEVQSFTLGRDGKPYRPSKKKGQKRTTRLVKMRPSRSKPQAQPEKPQDDGEGEPTHATDAVLEAQADDPDPSEFADARNYDSDSQSEYTASEGGTRYRRPDQSKKGGKLKAGMRKANAIVGQNFKRLKLRNSGAKGGPAHNSRFRRKR